MLYESLPAADAARREVCALRERLTREAGIENLEVVDPATPGYAQRAADLLNRDGFVVVRSTPPHLRTTS